MKYGTLISPKMPLTLLTKKVIIRGPSKAEGSKKVFTDKDSGANWTTPLGSPNFCI